MKQLLRALFVLSSFSLLAFAADKRTPAAKTKDATVPGTLTVINKITIKSQTMSMFALPVHCDGDGNIYVLMAVQPSSQIVKLGHNRGELLATFSSSSAVDLPIMLANSFTITPSGEVYQLAFPGNTVQRAVLVFNSDGSYKSGIKLDTPPGTRSWAPYQIGVFSSGDLLISGLLDDPAHKTTHPFSGIFSSQGQFRQEVTLADDAKIQKMVEDGDTRIVPPNQPGINRAVSGGQMLPGDDGNMYLMRNAYPPVFYVISPAGEVVRHFTVDVQDKVLSAHLSGHRIVLLSKKEGKNDYSVWLTVVDLEGNVVGTYQDNAQDWHDRLGSALACYNDNPERFTFLGTTEEGYNQFKIAEPR